MLAGGLFLIATQYARSGQGCCFGRLLCRFSSASSRRFGHLGSCPVAADDPVNGRLSRRRLAAASSDGVELSPAHVVCLEWGCLWYCHCWYEDREKGLCWMYWLLFGRFEERAETCEKMLEWFAEELEERVAFTLCRATFCSHLDTIWSVRAIGRSGTIDATHVDAGEFMQNA